MHLAIIYDDGQVWDFSFANNSLSPIKKLIQLPKSRYYFGYSDALGVIYFIHSDAEKGITKFHKSLNKNGHIIVPKSKKPLMRGGENSVYEYHHGVLLGNKFWTLAKYGRSNNIYHSWHLNAGTV